MGSASGTAWSLAQLQSALGERLQLEGVRGTFAHGLDLDRLVYEDEGVRVEARTVHLRTDPARALALRIELEALTAAEVDVLRKPTPPEPRTPPASLRLPLGVDLADGRIGVLTVRDPASDRLDTVRDIRLRYSGGPGGHRLDTLQAATEYGALILHGEIGGGRPFPVRGTLTLTGQLGAHPFNAGLDLSGSLERLLATLNAQSQGAHATVEATLAPFGAQPLLAIRGEARGIALQRFDAEWPATDLSLALQGSPGEGDTLRGTIEVHNAQAGPVDRSRLPLVGASTRFDTDLAQWRLDALHVDLANGGRLQGDARIDTDAQTATLNVRAAALNLRALYSTLRETALSGPLDIALTRQRQSVQGTLQQKDFRITADAVREGTRIDVRSLQAAASGGSVAGTGHIDLDGPMPFAADLRFAHFDPARFGDYPQGSLNGTAQANGQLQEAQRRVNLDWKITDSQLRGLALSSDGRARVEAERISQADAQARWGAAQLQAQGAFGRRGDQLRWTLAAPAIEQFDARLSGRLAASGSLSGDRNRATVEFDANGTALRLPGGAAFATLRAQGQAGTAPDAPLALDVRATQAALRDFRFARLQLRAEGTVAQHRTTLNADGQDVDLMMQVAGGWAERRGWSGRIEEVINRGRYPIDLRAPAPLQINADATRIELGRFDAAVADGGILIRHLEWIAGRLVSEGGFTHLPAAWLIYAGGLRDQITSTLALDGDWSLNADPTLAGRVSMRRAEGDLVLQSAPAIALGLRKLVAEAHFDARGMNAKIIADSTILRADIDTQLGAVNTPDGMNLTADSPLDLRARIDVASLRPFSALFATTGRMDGRVQASLRGSGHLASPVFQGEINGDALAFEMPPYGVYLKDGRLRAWLEQDTLAIDELTLHGGAGRFEAAGRMPLRMAEGGGTLTWRAQQLALMNRPDMRLVVSGDGGITMNAKSIALNGQLLAERGYFEIGATELPKLSDDVVIVGAKTSVRPRSAYLPFALDLRLDLGKNLEVHAYGYHGRLGGRIRLATGPEGRLLADGRIRTERGRFNAYGKELDVEQGLLTFDGPVDNPTLDVEAWRRNQAVEVGVKLSGTAQSPQVQLVSEPPVSEGEKLSWLVLGRAPDDAQGADLALLQAAAGTLFGRGDKVGINQKLARQLGLDDLSFRGSGQLTGNVVAVGKRFSDKLYITFEQGIGLAQNLVKLDYSLSRRWSARLETGTVSGLGLIYRIAFD